MTSPVLPPELLAVATRGDLRATGHVHRSVKAEIRQNLIDRLAAGEPSLPGIVGFDETVSPEIDPAPPAPMPCDVVALMGDMRLPELPASLVRRD